ncbi:MAG: hypothetical protein COA79_06900 [Planctomycetota bacterium]|nr:MAG: hypothetical protein COA79_06900 [Planctomycetota bacterium]
MELLIILILVIIFFACLMQAVFGFGSALFSMPLLAIVIPLEEAGPIVAISATFLAIIAVIPVRKQIQIKSVRWLLLGSVVGIPIGVFLLKQLSLQPKEIKLSEENIFGFLLGILIISFSIYQLRKRNNFELKSNIFAVPTGIFAGVLGGLINTTGPPIVVYGVLKRWDPIQFRASLQAYFMFSAFYISINHGYQGLWTSSVLQVTGYAIPVAILAVVVGQFINNKISTDKFTHLVYFLLIAIGVIFCGKSISYFI